MIVEKPAVIKTYRGTPLMKVIAVTRTGAINGIIQINMKMGANIKRLC